MKDICPRPSKTDAKAKMNIFAKQGIFIMWSVIQSHTDCPCVNIQLEINRIILMPESIKLWVNLRLNLNIEHKNIII